MTLVQRIQNLCSSKNTTLIGLEREIGLGRGTIRKWDEISPSIEKLKKVADYFNISIDLLLGETDNFNKLFTSNTDNESIKLSNPKIKPIIDSLDRAGDLESEDIDEIAQQVEFLINLKRKKK